VLPEARKKALELVARRPYSRKEIRDRLASRGYAEAVIDTVLDYLRDKCYQSDVGFAESFAEHRARKGHGRHSIRVGLAERGISTEDADIALDGVMDVLCTDWASLAIKVLRRKLPAGYELPADRAGARKDKARLHRFLQSRGFSTEQSMAALEILPQATVSLYAD